MLLVCVKKINFSPSEPVVEEEEEEEEEVEVAEEDKISLDVDTVELRLCQSAEKTEKVLESHT